MTCDHFPLTLLVQPGFSFTFLPNDFNVVNFETAVPVSCREMHHFRHVTVSYTVNRGITKRFWE